MRRLEEKIKELFPGTHLVVACSETSYYFPKVTKEKAKQLLGMVVRHRPEEGLDLLATLDKIPEGIPIIMRLRRRKNFEDKEFILSFKASANPLHDVERTEIETSDIDENCLEGFAGNGVSPESVWDSRRRVYEIDGKTFIDVEDVTGYGWKAEIESDSVEKVREVAGKLGLQPISPRLLDAMYNQYKKSWETYYAGEGENRHFREDDWREIESVSGAKVIKNRIPA